jgi:hypothetical protein
MNRYFVEKVTAIEPLDGLRVRVIFRDGFTGEVDLSPLLDCGPIFAPLRDASYFRQVTVVHGAPLWPDDLDLSPGALRAWCEAGRFMDYDETDAWIAEHIRPPERMAGTP